MTVRFFSAGIECAVPRVEASATGVRILFNERGDWLTLETRADCQMLMQLAADADSVFLRQQAAAAAHETVEAELAPLIDPDCGSGKHQSCMGGPCECACHSEPGLQPLPDERDRPVRTTVAAVHVTGRDDETQHAADEYWKRAGVDPADLAELRHDDEKATP